MLSVHPRDIQHQHQHQHQHQKSSSYSCSSSSSSPSSPPYHHSHFPHAHYGAMPHRVSDSPVLACPPLSKNPHDAAAVAQALEIARESPDGASDPTVSRILEQALAQAWGKVQDEPTSYVMTRDEFAVFNFFQHRFTGNVDAVAARRRYWANAQA